MDIDTWTRLFSAVVSVIALFPKDRRERTKDNEDVLAALSDAYHGTNKYYDYRTAHSRDHQRELDIAHKWYLLGVRIRKYDEALSERLDLKSRFWREGSTCDDDTVRDAKIGLDDMWRDVNIRMKA